MKFSPLVLCMAVSASAFAPAAGPRTFSRGILSSTTVEETEAKVEDFPVPPAIKTETPEAAAPVPVAVEQPVVAAPVSTVPDMSRIQP
jgi:hypothetical protein